MEAEQEKFARVVLWNLAILKSELVETRFLLAQVMGRLTETDAQNYVNQWKDEMKDARAELYLDLLKAAGLPPEAPPEESNGEFNPFEPRA